MRPVSRGTLRITSADPYAPPLLDLDCFAEDQDVRTVLPGIVAARKIARSGATNVVVHPAGDPAVCHRNSHFRRVEWTMSEDILNRFTRFDRWLGSGGLVARSDGVARAVPSERGRSYADGRAGAGYEQ
ncbi:GMC oxidoreductase [Streptomyces sp. NPDC059340]|uniref:GMC oxidoreductase n=1 Tax=Streptomyces sp. NPDC059340 TaxID=3346806 RepID=UPI0036B41E5D